MPPEGGTLTRGAATALLSLLLALFVSSCATTAPASLRRFEFTEPQMGLPFRIVLYAGDSARAEAAARAAFGRISQLNDILSDYEDNSELSRLSRSAGFGQGVPLSADLWRVLARAQTFARESGGAFDITVGPVVNLWRRARRQLQLPKPETLAEARRSVGWRLLQLDPGARSARLLAPKMRLDLGGIAKGYALEEALKVLRAQGIRRALISGGGDMVAGDAPPGRPGWRIELAPLDVTNAPPARHVLLRDAALATSGDLFQRLEIDGRRYSHIVDPRTGIGLVDHSLVTVIARDGMTADALATAVSVLGPQAGLALVARHRDAAAHIARQPSERLEVSESRRFGRYYDR